MALFIIALFLLINCVAEGSLRSSNLDKNEVELPKGVFPLGFSGVQIRVTDGTPPGYDEVYGYPEDIGGLIVEGPFPYENGPSIRSDDNLLGAYGLIEAAASTVDGVCMALPDDSPFTGSKDVLPMRLKQMQSCVLACNPDEIAAGAPDPCDAGSLNDPSLSNSKMSCFKIGDMITKGYTGMCGYNCTALDSTSTDTLKGCTTEDINGGNPNCMIYCDSRTFPTATALKTAVPTPAKSIAWKSYLPPVDDGDSECLPDNHLCPSPEPDIDCCNNCCGGYCCDPDHHRPPPTPTATPKV